MTVALCANWLPASAATTWHVTSSQDLGNGVCENMTAGDCTLRDAALDADPGDAIVIDAGINPILDAEIAIDEDLTISGQGATDTTVFGSNFSRLFNVGSITPAITVGINDLTITGGNAPDGMPGCGAGCPGGAGENGGGIRNAATLDLTGVAMTNNSAGNGQIGGLSLLGGTGGAGGGGGSGGAIWNSGTLTLTGSTLNNNQAGSGGAAGDGVAGNNSNASGGTGGSGGNGGSGGAIFSSGTLNVTDSTLKLNLTGASANGGNGGDDGGGGNVAGGLGGNGGNGGNGGGISSSGPLTLTRSTLNGNQTANGANGGNGGTADPGDFGGGNGGGGGAGGAVFSSASLTVVNSTLSGNTAGSGGNGGSSPSGAMPDVAGNGGSGGGISSGGSPASATNLTVASNSAGAAGSASNPGSAGTGGGVAGAVTLANTLITSNAPDNCSGSPVDGGHNLSYPSGTGCPGGTTTDPLLSALGNNGGPTQTRKLDPASAAVNGVPAMGANCPATDQRGILRPQGPACDIGAFESRAIKPVITATNPASPGNTASPRVIGTSPVGTVSIHTDAACATGALASGSEAAFASPGITVTVPANTTTTLYARTVNADGTTPCSASFAYTNSVQGSGGGPAPAAPDPKCTRLRKKLRRQQTGLDRADTEAKRSRIERNIADTRDRLRKLGC